MQILTRELRLFISARFAKSKTSCGTSSKLMSKISFTFFSLKRLGCTKVSSEVKVSVEMSPRFIISFLVDSDELWLDSFADAGCPAKEWDQSGNNKAWNEGRNNSHPHLHLSHLQHYVQKLFSTYSDMNSVLPLGNRDFSDRIQQRKRRQNMMNKRESRAIKNV